MMYEFDAKQAGKLSRLTNATFQFDPHFPIQQYSASYFLKSATILNQHFKSKTPKVLIQFFQHSADTLVCGLDEVIALIHIYAHNPADIEIKALHDGDRVKPFESVLTLEGNYADFAFLEGMIDGILMRRSSIATNAFQLATLTDKPIIFMGDRQDDFHNQAGDGYACAIGGINQVATDAMGLWTGQKGVGTMPHALIQHFEGDIVATCEAYVSTYPDSPLVALVDYHNDVIVDSLKVAKKFGARLNAVRVDTSPTMVDQYFMRQPEALGRFDPRGVNPPLLKALRQALDQIDCQHVKIIASGNFNAEKIRQFEIENTPVDCYGVGSSLLKINIGFTGDCVLLNGEAEAKAGRKYQPNSRLERYEYSKNK